ncbi:CHAT domain-containing protein [Streptomyces sp. NPDC056255]|uniref:CHAT domain-containing protein n=1 Tax=Streptomyces sp. NPDC056255 TaxID=3345764 RepID=UPI0035D7B726
MLSGLSALVIDDVADDGEVIRVLARTRDPPDAALTGQVVTVADAPGLPPLPGVAAEATRLAARFPAFGHLSGTAASRDGVLAAFRDAGWAHIACHASSYAAWPVDSALHLSDGPLTAGEVLTARSGQGHLAYLSACETVLAGSALADEVIHLGSAFHTAASAMSSAPCGASLTAQPRKQHACSTTTCPRPERGPGSTGPTHDSGRATDPLPTIPSQMGRLRPHRPVDPAAPAPPKRHRPSRSAVPALVHGQRHHASASLPPHVIKQVQAPMHQHRRLALLRRALHDETLPCRPEPRPLPSCSMPNPSAASSG